MNEQEFQQRLGDLIAQINDLPPEHKEKMEALARQTADRRARMRQSIGQLQESLDYLRMSIKYLVFDLEATRRENKYLREMLRQEDEGDEREGAD